MMWWIILAIYALGYVLSAKPLAEAFLEDTISRLEGEREADRRRYPSGTWRLMHPEGDIVPTAFGRRDAAAHAIVWAVAWPLTMTVLLLSRHITAPTERQRAAERELERIKAFAKREGLEYPDE